MAAHKLLDRVCEAVRTRHMSWRTEEAYVAWIRRFVRFHGTRLPTEMGAPEVQAFLSHLAVHGQVAASTQNQALAALLFPYRVVLETDLPPLSGVVRAKRPKRLPVVFSREEVSPVLAEMNGTHRLMACLLYGAGLRLLECLRLRAKDLDFAAGQLLVRDGNGARDRVTVLPNSLEAELKETLQKMRRVHEQDLRAGSGAVYLPYALARNYPNAER